MPLQVLHDRQVAANGALSSIRLGFNYSYRASWIAIALGFTVALLTVFTSGVGIALDSVAPLACLVAMLVVAEVIYTRFRPDVRIGATCGILAVFSTASLLAAIISHTSLRLGFPYIDNALSNADMVLGIYAPAIVLLFAEHPDFANFLAFVYSTSLPVCIACGLVLAASGRISRAQELAFAFTFCILFASTVSIFFQRWAARFIMVSRVCLACQARQAISTWPPSLIIGMTLWRLLTLARSKALSPFLRFIW
jgi:hypothetical protein